MKSRVISLLCLAAFLSTTTVSLTACESVSYYRQSVMGQWSILNKRRLVEEVLNDTDLDAQTRASLQTVQRARFFAQAKLGLPGDGSFMHYVDTGKRHVVWNVFATEELSVEPSRWCFPVAGCVAYRGYFDENDALTYASGLGQSGLDTFVGGVNAYSTLGWFRDPVLNTVLRYPSERLAALIFHELSHEEVYAKGDTVFNESFATTIEIEGLKQWLAKLGSDEVIESDRQRRSRRTQFTALLLSAREELASLYASDIDDAQKRDGKQAAFAKLKEDYKTLKERTWQGYDGYDAWFDRELNNAHLVPVASYHGLLPGFQALLAAHLEVVPVNASATNVNSDADMRQSFDSFYRAVKRLAKLPIEKRHRVITDMGEQNLIPQIYLPNRST